MIAFSILIRLLLVIGVLFIMKKVSFNFKDEKFITYLLHLATSNNKTNKAALIFKIVYSLIVLLFLFIPIAFNPSTDSEQLEVTFAWALFLFPPIILIDILYSDQVKREGKERFLTSNVQNWFSAKGRIGRRQYLMEMFVGLLFAVIVLISFICYFDDKEPLFLGVISIVLFCFWLYYIIITQIKRFHDFGWSGGSVLLLSIIFPLLVVIFSTIRTGNPNDNEYGKSRRIPIKTNENSQTDNNTKSTIIL